MQTRQREYGVKGWLTIVLLLVVLAIWPDLAVGQLTASDLSQLDLRAYKETLTECYTAGGCTYEGHTYKVERKSGGCSGSPGGSPSPCDGGGPATLAREDSGSYAGNPLDIATGNKYQREVDLPALPGILGLEVVRYYNSRYAQGKIRSGPMGRGWRLSYETRLYVVDHTLQILQADGTRLIFDRDANDKSRCSTPDPRHGQVVIGGTPGAEEYTWIWTHGASAGRQLVFDAQGHLQRIEAPSGEAVHLDHDERGYLRRVTDPQGRQLQLNYLSRAERSLGDRFADGVQSIDTPAGRIVYEYAALPLASDNGVRIRTARGWKSLSRYGEPDPDDNKTDAEREEDDEKASLRLMNLVRVHWPTHYAANEAVHAYTSRGRTTSTQSRIYHYEDERYPNLLTGVSAAGFDANDHYVVQRLSRFAYNEAGLAVLSEQNPTENGARGERVVLKELRPSQWIGFPGQTVLENERGEQTQYHHEQVGGLARLVESRGPGCASCSPGQRRYRYDDQGRMTDVIELDENNQPHSGTRWEYDGWGRTLRIGRVDYTVDSKPADASVLPTAAIPGKSKTVEPKVSAQKTAQKTAQTAKQKTTEAETESQTGSNQTLFGVRYTWRDKGPAGGRVDWQIRYEYAAPQRLANGTDIVIERPVLIARPSVVAGYEHRIRIDYNEMGQPVTVSESGYRPALPWPEDETAGFIKTAAVMSDARVLENDSPALNEPERIERTTTYRYERIDNHSVLVEIDGPLPNGPKNTPEDSDITRYRWDNRGRYVEQIIQPGGVVHQLQRDESGRVALDSFDDSFRHIDYKNTYTSRGVLTERTRRAWKHSDPKTVLSETQRYQTDLFERLTTAIAADGRRQRLAYDEQGRLSGYTAPGGERIEWRYDRQNRPFAQVVFDDRGQVTRAQVTVRDDLGRILATLSPKSVDTFNPVLSVPLPAALTTALADETRTDETPQMPRDAIKPRQQVWRDDFGRIAATLSPDDGLMLTRYESSAQGERQTQIYWGRHPLPAEPADLRRATRWETLTFDPAGRLVQREHPACTEKLIYEGQLLSRLESCGSQQHFERDAFGLVTEHQQNLGGHIYRETYRYGPAGRLIERRTAGGATLFYDYDQAGRLSRVAKKHDSIWRAWLPERWNRQSLQSNLQWAPLATQPSGATYSNGAQWQDFYDPAGRLSEYRLKTQAGTLYQAQTRWYQNKPVQERRNAQVHTRLYDPAGRLLPNGLDPQNLEGTHRWRLPATLWKTGASGPTATGTTADPMLRPVADTIPEAASLASALTPPTHFYTAEGQRTGAWGNSDRQDTAPLQRNGWGEQIERQGQRLIWDDEGHLSAIEQNGRKQVSYRYDVRGIRISKTLHTAAGDKQIFYLYDVDQRLSAETDSRGQIVREYLYNGTRPYALLEAGHIYAIYSDARGLPLYMLDEQQRVVWQGQWDDWGAGAADITPSSMNLDLRLAGQYYDAESGLYYNIHRYYDPGQGAYISPDPLGERIGEHRYAYLGHDPLDGIDPQGLFKIPNTTFNGNLTLFDNEVDGGRHGDIVNAAFALYHQRVGETRFSRQIINQIILNNYHSDGMNDLMFGTSAGGGNPLNHFDNPNAGLMYDANHNLNESYRDGTHDNWIQDALNQINRNRNAYEAPVKQVRGTIHFLTSYNDISNHIGRLGQNLHTLADFYAHTNWVDSTQRGGACQNKGTITGYVPTGLARGDLWDEKVIDGLFSGTANSLGETMTSDEMYTHAYWNKDTETTEGGRRSIGENGVRSDQYYWQAVTYTLTEDELRRALEGENPPVFGQNYITDTGRPPRAGERVYARTKINNAYDLAMSLAIEHTIQEIERFYRDAGTVEIGNLTLQDVLMMDGTTLEDNLIKYDAYPDKMTSHR